MGKSSHVTGCVMSGQVESLVKASQVPDQVPSLPKHSAVSTAVFFLHKKKTAVSNDIIGQYM